MGKRPKKKPGGHTGPSLPADNPLTLEERTELKRIFDSEVFRKAFSNARLMKPSILPPGLGTALGGQIALIQLSRIQGWEMFEAALARQTQDKLPAPEPLEPNYADPEFPPITPPKP